ncbi:class I SAM-dependent methyltransferase [uncultured Dubosiella sp.]|uniref:tRNA (mnm(5)s(2)U34)-methyltransferase n=1 Tax=uncultured Dubosiella sp. TaxID=1937011 RepID=UPI0025B5C046|nr:class I SAM-dependent methyltransferase [uncultured Dubosiella sp.]
MKSMVEIAHGFREPCLHRQAVCVDATFGNGKDTAFFVECGARLVYAFDIQKELIEKRRGDFDERVVELIVDSHAHLDWYVDKPVDAIVFNFGFCPHGDETITTMPKESVEAVEKAIGRLRKKGRMALVLYPHLFGEQESDALERVLRRIDPHVATVQRVESVNTKAGPFVLLVEKKAGETGRESETI